MIACMENDLRSSIYFRLDWMIPVVLSVMPKVIPRKVYHTAIWAGLLRQRMLVFIFNRLFEIDGSSTLIMMLPGFRSASD